MGFQVDSRRVRGSWLVFITALALVMVMLPFWGSSALAVSFSPATLYPVGSQPNAVTVGDFNRDGNLDIAVANEVGPPCCGSVSIFLGDGKGGFSGPTNFASGDSPFSIAVGDFNEDGKLDLAVAHVAGSTGVSIMLGNGDGTFQPPMSLNSPNFGSPFSVAVADVNGDHHADVIATNDSDAGIDVWTGHGDGTFSAPSSFPAGGMQPNFLTVADVNGDGHPDVVDVNRDANGAKQVSTLLGDGLGGFGPPMTMTIESSVDTQTLAIGDLNGDGHPDLVVADFRASNSHIFVLLGNGLGGFSAPTAFAAPNDDQFPVIGDFNGDGKPDVAVISSNAAAAAVMLGDGMGGLGKPEIFPTHPPGTIAPSFGMAVGDFNKDGKPDIALSARGSNDLAILLNQGIGYPRPRGATPTRASLVPAYQACTSPNSTHGAPLSHPSCAPPVQSSSFLTLGTLDANGAGANGMGSVAYSTVVNSPPSPNDVLINVSTTDVRCQLPVNTTCGSVNVPAGPDYTGELQATSTLRITDRDYSPIDSGTTVDTPFRVAVPCVATTDTSIGSACAVSTSANAVVPGSVQTGNRAIWEMGQVQVYDGGASGVAGSSDATLFMDEGVFVP